MAPVARSRRSARKRAKAGSVRSKAAYPSPSAQTVRASQYDASLSDGSGCSTGSALGLQGAVRLHPEHDVAAVGAGRGLQVGEPAQHLVRRTPAGRAAGLLPVAQVDHRGTGHVVGVERALAVGVGGRVVGATADALEGPVVLAVGVGPERADRRLLRHPVGRVPGLLRRRHGVAQEVEVGEVGQPRRCGGGGVHSSERHEHRHRHDGRHESPEHGHPFTPLLSSAPVNLFWNTTNRATAGAASTTAPARIAPYGLSARPAMLLM